MKFLSNVLVWIAVLRPLLGTIRLGPDARPYFPSSNQTFSKSLAISWAESGRTSRAYRPPSDAARALEAIQPLTVEFSGNFSLA